MAPDFEYFFGLARPASHTFPGVITFTFPLALAVLVIFQAVVKWPLISLLPRGLQARVIAPARQFRWLPMRRLILTLLSLAIGIATHILCDDFTHPNGWAVAHFPVLRHTVIRIAGLPIAMYYVLQFGLSLAGLLALAVYFLRWYRRAPQSEDFPPRFSPAANSAIVSTMVLIAIALGWMSGNAGVDGELLREYSDRLRFIIAFVITGTTVAAIEAFAFSIVWRMFLARNTERAAVQAIRDC